MKGYELTRFLPSLVCLHLLVACSDAPQWTGSVEMRDGVEIISNPADPLLGRAPGSVSELWAVQGSTWEDPSRVHADTELVIIVDPRASQLHPVTTSGETRASLGRSGGGPGEFVQLQDAFRDGDRLVVLDGRKSSVEYLDLDGAYLSSLRLERSAWGGFPLGDGELLIKGDFRTDPSEETLGDWISVRESSEPVRFTPPPLELLPEEQGVQCSDLAPWAGSAARLRFTTPQIQVLDRSGGVIMESRIDLPVEPVSDAERDSALSALRRRLAASETNPEFMQQTVMVMEERWRVKCRFGPLRFDPARRLAAFLEQNPDQFGSGNATLHFLSQDGVYLAKVSFPTAWRDFTMDGGVIYALTRDPTTDVITLRAYRVDLPNSLFSDAAEALEEARHRATP